MNFSWVFPVRGAVSSSQLVERNAKYSLGCSPTEDANGLFFLYMENHKLKFSLATGFSRIPSHCLCCQKKIDTKPQVLFENHRNMFQTSLPTFTTHGSSIRDIEFEVNVLLNNVQKNIQYTWCTCFTGPESTSLHFCCIWLRHFLRGHATQ